MCPPQELSAQHSGCRGDHDREREHPEDDCGGLTQSDALQPTDQWRHQQTEHQCNAQRDKYSPTDIEQGQHRCESNDTQGAVVE